MKDYSYDDAERIFFEKYSDVQTYSIPEVEIRSGNHSGVKVSRADKLVLQCS
jgi:hypothetical protein